LLFTEYFSEKSSLACLIAHGVLEDMFYYIFSGAWVEFAIVLEANFTQ
jgi:hypothetical protein